MYYIELLSVKLSTAFQLCWHRGQFTGWTDGLTVCWAPFWVSVILSVTLVTLCFQTNLSAFTDALKLFINPPPPPTQPPNPHTPVALRACFQVIRSKRTWRAALRYYICLPKTHAIGNSTSQTYFKGKWNQRLLCLLGHYLINKWISK